MPDEDDLYLGMVYIGGLSNMNFSAEQTWPGNTSLPVLQEPTINASFNDSDSHDVISSNLASYTELTQRVRYKLHSFYNQIFYVHAGEILH